MSLLETEDYFDIPAENHDRKGGEFKPAWSSADPHLHPQSQERVQFLATNSRFTQANLRDKIPSKVLKAMEVDQEATRVLQNGEGDSCDTYVRNTEKDALDAWNPLAEDYESKAFNSYKEPSVADFVKSFPGNSEPFTSSCLRSEEGDVRLFVGRIPQQMTGEGLHNLFSQVGKLKYCKLIPQHNKDSNIGFLGYETVREAEAAIQRFDGFDLGQGARLKVALALTKQKPNITDPEESEPIVNSTACNGVPESTKEGASIRQNEASLPNGVSSSTKSEAMPTGKPCSFCGKSGLKWCSVCKIPYCSPDCQKNDWPKHKFVCPRQTPAERKTAKPGTYEETNAPLTTTAGDVVQPNAHTREQTDFPHTPPGDSSQRSEESVTNNVHRESDEETGSSSENERNPVRVDGFDVNNVEKFAEMMGFDLNQVKFVEKSKDSDDSDRSSSCSLDNNIPQEALSKVPVPVPPREVLSQQTFNTESGDTITIEPASPLAETVSEQSSATPQKPTCSKGHKRFYIKQLPMESVPAEGLFEAVVTEVENPGCIWAQLCTPEALQRQGQLKKNLQASYCNSVYENYVPSRGEVCVAQFSFDSCWYRVKVDIVNNTGTLRVTYIDFGNHEDVTVDRVRRITEDLVSFPRQALKLSLHGITSTSPSGKWPTEATAFVKSKVLGIKCKVQVGGQHNEILFVKLFDPKETNSDNAINGGLMKAGFAKARRGVAASPNTLQQNYSSPQHGGQSGSQRNIEHRPYGQKAGFDKNERRPFQQGNSSQGQDGTCEQQRSQVNQVKSPSYQSGSKERSNSSRNATSPGMRREPFEVIINAIVNPWEFFAQKTDPLLVDKLNALMRDLNRHINGNSASLQSKASFSSGEVCAAKFSLDNLWYRAVILEKHASGFRVRYVDFGNSEIVQGGSICPLPQQFQSFPPLSLQCSLAGVKKPKGQEWSPEVVRQFKSLVANKPFMCRIVHTHGVTNIVELLDPRQNREQTVAKSLISAGLADAFIHQDGTVHQLDEKRGTQKLGDGGAPVPKSPCSDVDRSSFSPQSSPIHSGGPRDGIESAVFERAIQAADLSKDARLDVLVTEVVSPGLVYCQIGSKESLRKSAKLTQDMNEHYSAASYPSFVAKENVLCAAHFAQTGDWCRAFIKGTSPDGLVYVHYVDYGNTEFVPLDRLRPLNEQFNFEALPFAALRCSLPNIFPFDSSGWSNDAMVFVKTLLPVFCRHSMQVVGRKKGQLFADITASETGESVSQALVRQGLARAVAKGERRDQQNPQHPIVGQSAVRESRRQTSDNHTLLPQKGTFERRDVSLLESLVFQPAIHSATLPQDKSCFDVMLTEVTKSGVFFIQVADHRTAQNLKELSEEMNTFYRSSQPTSFFPQPSQLCVALYTETGDWCRAFVKEVTPKGLVDLHYVDFGNSEKLPVSSTKPLEDKFASVPFFALPCCLANIAQAEPPGWSDQATALFDEKVPLFQRASARLLGKRHGMLFVDFVISKDPPQFLSQILVNEGFAERTVRGESRREHQGGRSSSQEQPKSSSRQSASSKSSLRPAGDLQSRVLEPAIQSVSVLDSFDAMLTDVSSPSSLYIQVLRRDTVDMMEQLSADLNTHYRAANYPPFQAQTNQLCAGLFSGSGDWCRGFIKSVSPDGSVNVHYLDYGNSEVLSSSQVRPLEDHFQQHPPMALKCSLAGILPIHSNGWSNDAREAVLSQAPLNSPVKVKVIRKESGILFIDATSPDSSSQQSLSQFLVSEGLAAANPPDERPYSGKLDDQPEQSAPSAPTSRSDNRLYASAISAVDLSNGNTFKVVISEVQQPDKIFFQVLNQENAQALVALSEMLNTHCCTVDKNPYKPVLGELCLAQFSGDQCWYRAVVEQEVSESQMMVVFVDYGNQDVVSVDSIRRITRSFILLPIQARECYLAGIQPVPGSSWSNDAVNFLRDRLTAQTSQTPQTFFAQVDSTQQNGCSLGVQLFEVNPNGQPGISISQDMIQRNLAQSQDNAACSTLQVMVPNVDQFDVVVTEVVHPGEIWAQVLDAEARNSLDSLMTQINQYCVEAPLSASALQPGQECCGQFSQDGVWYRARALECPSSGQVAVQYVDFGNSEWLTPDKIRPMKDKFFKLPAQALKLSLANIRPAHQVWSQEAVEWLKIIANRQLKAKIVHRLPEHLVVSLEDWSVANGPVNISDELINMGHAVKS